MEEGGILYLCTIERVITFGNDRKAVSCIHVGHIHLVLRKQNRSFLTLHVTKSPGTSNVTENDLSVQN